MVHVYDPSFCYDLFSFFHFISQSVSPVRIIMGNKEEGAIGFVGALKIRVSVCIMILDPC